MSANQPQNPQGPQDPQGCQNPAVEPLNVNSQTAELENWDENAFPLMIERSDPEDGIQNFFTTLNLETAETIHALLTKSLRLVTESGIIICPPVIADHPDAEPLAEWLRVAVAAQKARRAKKAGSVG